MTQFLNHFGVIVLPGSALVPLGSWLGSRSSHKHVTLRMTQFLHHFGSIMLLGSALVPLGSSLGSALLPRASEMGPQQAPQLVQEPPFPCTFPVSRDDGHEGKGERLAK